MTIELFVQGNSWVAYHKGPGSEEITDLFDSPVIPTAFTAAADRFNVLARIQALNPDCNVFLR